MNEIKLKPIGVIHSKYIDDKDPVQHENFENYADSIVEIFDEYKDGLYNLAESYSHIFITYWMHLVNENQRYVSRWKIADDGKYPEMGTFCGTGSSRPNPIGITPCRIISINRNIINLKGLDALDGSPVLDIKGYTPQSYLIVNAKYPKWITTHHKRKSKDKV